MWKIIEKVRELKKYDAPKNLSSLTIMETRIPEYLQDNYSQVGNNNVEDLFIKFIKEEEINMPEYNILSDDGNKIVYEEVTRNTGDVEREQVATYRARIDAIRKNIEDENAEIIELELAIEKGEMLIEIANKKREEEKEQPIEEVEKTEETEEVEGQE